MGRRTSSPLAEATPTVSIQHKNADNNTLALQLCSLTRSLSLQTSLLSHGTSSSSSQSVFQCITPPPITLPQYATRLGTYLMCDSSVFVTASVYLQRLWCIAPHLFCDLAEMKLMFTSCILAIKFLEDQFFTNTYYAECGGVELAELNQMEISMLQLLDFRLYVSAEDFCGCELLLQNADDILKDAEFAYACSSGWCATTKGTKSIPTKTPTPSYVSICFDSDDDASCDQQR